MDAEDRKAAQRGLVRLEQYEAELLGLVRKWRPMLEDICRTMGSPPIFPDQISGPDARLAAACLELIRVRLNKEDLENELIA